LARDYDLPSLEELAKFEIERLGDGLYFPVIIDLVRIAYPHPSADDTWFSDYLKSGLELLLRNPSGLSDCGVPNTERKTLSVSDLLFKSLVELVRNHEIWPRGLDAAPQLAAHEVSTLVTPVPTPGSSYKATIEMDYATLSNNCELNPPVDYRPGVSETCEQIFSEEAEEGYGLVADPIEDPIAERVVEPEPEPIDDPIADR